MSPQPLRRFRAVPPAPVRRSALPHSPVARDCASPARGILLGLALSTLVWLGLCSAIV